MPFKYVIKYEEWVSLLSLPRRCGIRILAFFSLNCLLRSTTAPYPEGFAAAQTWLCLSSFYRFIFSFWFEFFKFGSCDFIPNFILFSSKVPGVYKMCTAVIFSITLNSFQFLPSPLACLIDLNLYLPFCPWKYAVPINSQSLELLSFWCLPFSFSIMCLPFNLSLYCSFIFILEQNFFL